MLHFTLTKQNNCFQYIDLHVSVVDHATTDFSKTQELIVQTCDTGGVHTLLWICSGAETSVQQESFLIFKPYENMQKQVMNLHDFEKAVLHRIVFRFFMRENSLFREFRDKINCSGSVSWT
jgi:hypothetical protein